MVRWVERTIRFGVRFFYIASSFRLHTPIPFSRCWTLFNNRIIYCIFYCFKYNINISVQLATRITLMTEFSYISWPVLASTKSYNLPIWKNGYLIFYTYSHEKWSPLSIKPFYPSANYLISNFGLSSVKWRKQGKIIIIIPHNK